MNTTNIFSARHPALERRIVIAAGLAALSLGLGGCYVAYPYQPYPTAYVATAAPEPQYVEVYQEPPRRRVEVIGMAPQMGMVWIPGNWVWRNRWSWDTGYWARPPHPHARWDRGRWDHGRHHDRDDWRWRRGRWDD